MRLLLGLHALDVSKVFITDELIEMIVEKTNLCDAEYLRANPNLVSHKLVKQWEDVKNDGIKTFLALRLLMGIVQKPFINLPWSQETLFKLSVFDVAKSRNRF